MVTLHHPTSPLRSAPCTRFISDAGTRSPRASTQTHRMPTTRCVAVSPDFAHDGMAFAGMCGTPGARRGLWCTYDGGRTWEHLIHRWEPEFLAISPNFSRDATLWAICDQGRVRCSRTSGASWDIRGAVPRRTVLGLYALPAELPSVRLLLTTTGGHLTSDDDGWQWDSTQEES